MNYTRLLSHSVLISRTLKLKNLAFGGSGNSGGGEGGKGGRAGTCGSDPAGPVRAEGVTERQRRCVSGVWAVSSGFLPARPHNGIAYLLFPHQKSSPWTEMVLSTLSWGRVISECQEF